MRQGFNASRVLIAAVVAMSLLATSGCGWFRSKKDPYKNAPENRPLEIPPDLDRPNTDPAMEIPVLPRSGARNAPATVGAVAQALSTHSAFLRNDSLDSTWHRAGLALARMESKGGGTEVRVVAAGGRMLS